MDTIDADASHRALKACHDAMLNEVHSTLASTLESIFVKYELKLHELLQETVGVREPPPDQTPAPTVLALTEQSGSAAPGQLKPGQPTFKSGNVFLSELTKEAMGICPKKAKRKKFASNRKGVLSVDLATSDLETNVYKVENFYKKTGVVQSIVCSPLFNYITMLFIATNAVYLGFDAQLNTSDVLLESDLVWIVFENVFCAYFTIEIVLRFCAFERKRDCMNDGWFKFDSMLVLLMIFEVWFTIAAALLNVSMSAVPTAPFRLLRLLRLSRLVRLLRTMPELVTMSRAMWVASRAVLSSIFMVFCLVYVFSIVMFMLCKGLVLGGDANSALLRARFDTLSLCMWTMLADGFLMADTSTALTALRDANTFDGYLAVIIFVAFMFLVLLAVANLLIGVLCQVVTAVGRHERDEADVILAKSELLSELRKYDQGDSTMLSEDLGKVLANRNICEVLEELKVDLVALEHFLETFFQDSTDRIPIRFVMETCLDYRGGQSPTVKHLVDGSVLNRYAMEFLVSEAVEEMSRFVIGKNDEILKHINAALLANRLQQTV